MIKNGGNLISENLSLKKQLEEKEEYIERIQLDMEALTISRREERLKSVKSIAMKSTSSLLSDSPPRLESFYEQEIMRINQEWQMKVKNQMRMVAGLKSDLSGALAEMGVMKEDFERVLADNGSLRHQLTQLELVNSLNQEEAARKVDEAQNEMRKIVEDQNQEIASLKQEVDRLNEENETYENLLYENTLEGNMLFENHSRRCSKEIPVNSIAAELERVPDVSELQSHISALEEDNRALILYIRNILSRLLECDDEKTLNTVLGPKSSK